MKTPANFRILVGCRDERVGRFGELLRRVIAAILDHQLEATGRAQTLHGGRIDHDDDGILDASQAARTLGSIVAAVTPGTCFP